MTGSPCRPLPVIAIDNIRASVLPHQVLNNDPPITGLHVGGDSSFLPFALDENDSILQEHVPTTAGKEDAELDNDMSSVDDNSCEKGEEGEALDGNTSEAEKSEVASINADRSEEEDDEEDSQTDLPRGALSFQGDAEDKNNAWDKMFACLIAFKEEFGHTNPHYKYKTPDGTDLGAWVASQKLRACKWKERGCTQSWRQRIDRLDSIGFSWSTRMKDWESWYALLVDFKEKNSHTRVPASYVDTSTGSKLGHWVSNQRKRYANKQRGITPSISEARIERLNSLGFEWSPRNAAPSVRSQTSYSNPQPWSSWFQLLVEYKEREGHTRVPQSYMDESSGRKLGAWVANQRGFYSRKQRGLSSNLNEDRVQKLESISFEWVVRGRATKEIQLCSSHGRASVGQSLSHQATEVQDANGEEEVRSRSKLAETVVNPTAAQSERAPCAVSQSSSATDDDATLAELEKNLLQKLDDEVTAAEERESLKRLDWDIRKAEELDSLAERLGEPVGLIPEVVAWRCVAGGIEAANVGTEHGIQVEIELDSSLAIGANLKQEGSDILIAIKDESGQLARALGPRATDAGATVLAVEGLPCESIADFKKIKAGVASRQFALLLGLGRGADLTGLNSEYIVNGPFLPEPSGGASDSFLGASSPVTETAHAIHDKSTGSSVDELFEVETETKGPKRAKNTAYKDFVNKFINVVVAEFHASGIHPNFALGQMWKQHRGRFGASCPDGCKCISNLTFLTETIVAEQLKKSVERPDSKWDNPLRLKPGDYPVGLLKNFAQKFVPRLQSEYKDDSSSKILERLLSMWKQHLRTLVFGLKCRDDCVCTEGWEPVFNKGALKKDGAGFKLQQALGGPKAETTGKSRKRRLSSNHLAANDLDDIPPNPISLDTPMPRKRRPSFPTREAPTSLTTKAKCGETKVSSGRSDSVGDLDSSAIPRKRLLDEMPHGGVLKSKKLKAKPRPASIRTTDLSARPKIDERGHYCVHFRIGEPLGFYVVSDSEETCTVLSVCPRGQATRDIRIQKGSTVTATGTSAEREQGRPVTSHHDLKRQFEEANREGIEDFFVWFVNNKVTGKHVLDGTIFASDDWSSSGRWRGENSSGWDGRHAFLSETRSTISVPPVGPDNGPAELECSTVVVTAQDPEPGLTVQVDAWTNTSEMRPLMSRDFEPRSVLVTDKSTRTRRVERNVQFSDMDEERRYVKGCPTHEFQVTSTGDTGSNRFRDLCDPASPSSFNAMDELYEAVVHRKVDDILQFIENGGLSQFGSESEFEPSRTEVKRRLKAIQSRRPSGEDNSSLGDEKELIRKDRLLKICIYAYSVARQAWSHKCCEGFEMEVVKIHNLQSTSLVQQNASSMIAVDVAVLEDVGKGRTDGKLPRMKFNQVLLYETTPFQKPVFYNTRTTQKHSTLHLDINVVNGREPLSLGSARITLAEIQQKCATNRDWTTIEFEATPTSFLSRCTVVLRVRRVSDSFRQRHSQVLCTNSRRELHDLITWIKRFNAEAGENDHGRLSADIRTVNNITPLHSAILLRDETLTKMLLEVGANPLVVSGIGTATSLAQKMAYTLQEGRHENADITSGRGVLDGDYRRIQEHKERFRRIINRLRERAESLAVGLDTEKESRTTDSQSTSELQINTQTDHQPRTTQSEATSRQVDEVPVLKDTDWIKWRCDGKLPCRHWNRDHTCSFGERCLFVHRQRPWDDQFQSIWEEMKPSDRLLNTLPPMLPGEIRYMRVGRWVTAGYTSCRRNVSLHVVYAEGGDRSTRSEQGIYWYESEKEAERWLKRAILVSKYAMKNQIAPRSLLKTAAGQRKGNASPDLKMASKESPAVPVEADTALRVQDQPSHLTPDDAKTEKKKQGLEVTAEQLSERPVTSNEGRLPGMTRIQVLEEWTTRSLCRFFGGKTQCVHGKKCRYAHVEGSIGKVTKTEHLVAEVPDRLVPVRSIGRWCDNKVWYAMGYRDEDQTIYLAEGGVRGRKSTSGVWWYPTEQDAESALCVVVAVAKMRRALLPPPGHTARKRL